MKARVYNRSTDEYFKSEVYAIINQGWFVQYLVLVPSSGKAYLRLFDYIDKWPGALHSVNVNIITSEVLEDWVIRDGAYLDKVRKMLRKAKSVVKFDHYMGYLWLLEDSNLLASLITGQSVSYDDTDFKTKKVDSAIEGWNYIECQEDINTLQDVFCGFHDSVIKDLNYISGSKLLDNGCMAATDNIRQVSITIDSQWSKSIEMVFEGVVALNLRPAQDNYSSEIFGASIIMKDASIFFCNDIVKSEQLSYEGTWIKAFGLRWRYALS